MNPTLTFSPAASPDQQYLKSQWPETGTPEGYSSLFPEQATNTMSASSQEKAPPLRHILVVEDDESVRFIVTQLLVISGYMVTSANDGEKGWDSLCSTPFDLLITDNSMPRLSGIGLLRRLRANAMTVPVILVSGDMPWSDLKRPPSLQPWVALEKPFSTAALLQQVRLALSQELASTDHLPQTSPNFGLRETLRAGNAR